MRRKPIPKEYLGAFKAGHRQSAREFIDEELSYELLKKFIETGCEESKKALAYIAKFNNEYHKAVVKRGDTEALHNTPELRKNCYDRNNARNRDITSRENRFLLSTEPSTREEEDGTSAPYDWHLNTNRELRNFEAAVVELIDTHRNPARAALLTLPKESPAQPLPSKPDAKQRRTQAMPKKTKKSKDESAQTAEVAPVSEIPKDLQDKLGSASALTQTYNLLQKGYFPYGYSTAVGQSLAYIEALHSQVLADCKAHPQASMVPALQQQSSTEIGTNGKAV